jgi:hypothetical protein
MIGIMVSVSGGVIRSRQSWLTSNDEIREFESLINPAGSLRAEGSCPETAPQ